MIFEKTLPRVSQNIVRNAYCVRIFNTRYALRATSLVHIHELAQKNYFFVALALLLTAYQLARVIAFVNVYGGIEHDGGWMLSISRSLAERGQYTTMVSTIVDPTSPTGINVDQKFDIQTPDGRVWFFTGNGIGPASIVPDALVLKIFGSGFWALRAGPLIFYALFLLLAALILYRLAGVGAVVLFHAFLFFYPHLSIFLSYEAMGEVPTIFYVLWAYLAFAAATRAAGRRGWWFLGAGLVVGLALNAKLIALWSISGIFIWAGVVWVSGIWYLVSGFRFPPGGNRRVSRLTAHAPRLALPELLMLGAGTILPLLLWELVHGVVLTRLTDFDSYLLHTQQRVKFILDDGSGVGLQIHSGPEFFRDKFFLLSEVAHPQRWVTAIIFGAILLGSVALLWLWRRHAYRQNLLAPMWLGWLANTAWFVGLAKTGWPRHFWFGLVLAVMLLCVITISLLKGGRLGDWSRFAVLRPSSFVIDYLPPVVGVVLLVLIGWGFASQPHVWGVFLPGEIVPYWQQKQLNNKYDASLPWIIIPRQAQAEIVEYIKQLPPEARVFYPGQHKAAEIPPQTGRVHYPLPRRSYLEPQSADVVLIGTSLISPWKEPVQRRDLIQLVEQQCPRPAVKNDYYMICSFADNPVQP